MEEHNTHCPYCGEPISLLIDCSIPEQHYVEDCQVCCSPILVGVTAGADCQIESVSVRQENE